MSCDTEYRFEKVCPCQCVQLLLWICWNFVFVSRFMQVTYWFSLILSLNISGYLLYVRNSMNYSSIASHLKVFWRWLDASSVLYFIPSFPFLPYMLNFLSWLLQKLLAELLRKLDADLKHEICHWAAHYVSKQFKNTISLLISSLLHPGIVK